MSFLFGKSKTYSRKGLMEQTDSTKDLESEENTRQNARQTESANKTRSPRTEAEKKENLTKRISMLWDQGMVPLDESTSIKPKERVSATGLRENHTADNDRSVQFHSQTSI